MNGGGGCRWCNDNVTLEKKQEKNHAACIIAPRVLGVADMSLSPDREIQCECHQVSRKMLKRRNYEMMNVAPHCEKS
jgi:hypothetical protein